MNVLYAVFFFLLGSIFASFYGVMAYRLPLNKSIVKPRSHCENCNHVLSWWELIPIVSYIILRGKCSKCHKKIGFVSFLVEVFLGCMFAFAYLYYGFSYELFVFLLLISLFVLIFLTDVPYMIILDSPLIVTSLGVFFLKWYYFDMKTAFLAVLSGVVIFLLMLLIGMIGKWIFKRDALGGGDIKLAFVFGLVLGIPHALIALVLSTFLALPYATFSLFHSNEREVPYGPSLISALCLVFVFYDKFTSIVNLFYWM